MFLDANYVDMMLFSKEDKLIYVVFICQGSYVESRVRFDFFACDDMLVV